MVRQKKSTANNISSPVAVQAQPAKTGRQRTLSSKQQKLVEDQLVKEASAKEKAYTEALRAHQAREEAMGFQKVTADGFIDNSLGPESEGEDDPDETESAFNSITVPAPIVKTTIRDGRTLIHRVNKENQVAASPPAVPTGPRRPLVRRCGVNAPRAPPVMAPAPHASPVMAPATLASQTSNDKTTYYEDHSDYRGGDEEQPAVSLTS
jgi:hypothetical protein